MTQPSLFGEPGGGPAVAHIDGGSRGNPGPAGYGVRIEQDGQVIELKESCGVATNNVAEYSGLLCALRWAVDQGVAVTTATRDGLCSVCHVRLRPQVFQLVRQNDSIIQCDSCQRILYYIPPPPPIEHAVTHHP